MSEEIQSKKSPNKWAIALLVSLAANGLLGGVLLAKQMATNQQAEQLSVQAPELKSEPKTKRTAAEDPRHLTRSLSEKRRREVMAHALKNLKLQGSEHPRHLFKQLRQSKSKTMRLFRADELDIDAIKVSLAETRALNQKMAVSGDALILEVLAQMTPEERKTAKQNLKQRRQMRQKRRQKRMQDHLYDAQPPD